LLCQAKFLLLLRWQKRSILVLTPQCKRLADSERLSWSRPVPRESCISEGEESKFVHRKQPTAALWHEMTMGRGNLSNITRPSV